jgi:hypothetical protein
MGRREILIPSRKTVADASLFACGLFLVIGIAYLVDAVFFNVSAVRTEGTIIRFIEKEDDSDSSAPVISYMDHNGVSHEMISNRFSSPPWGSVGEKAAVYYSRSNPGNSRLATETGRFSFPVILLGISMFFFMSAVYFHKSRKSMDAGGNKNIVVF